MGQYPGKFLVDVTGTAAKDIFQNSPHVTDLSGHERVTRVRMENELVNESGRPVHFMESYTHTLARQLGVSLKLTVSRPYVYLSDEERSWMPRVQEITGKAVKYWVVCQPGAKSDYTVKRFPREYLEAVIDHFKGKLVFVQVGEAHHDHRPLAGAIDEIGRTDCRQLLRMVGHPLCQGVLTGESFLWHVAAAFQKPAVCLASGFLPRHWVDYPTGRFLSKHGCLPCCRQGACWRSRVVPLNDGDGKDRSLCELPVLIGGEWVPKCQAMTRPDEVVRAIEDYYTGGVLSF